MHRLPRLVSNPSGCPRHGVAAAADACFLFRLCPAEPPESGDGTRHLPASSPSAGGGFQARICSAGCYRSLEFLEILALFPPENILP